jgi:hypothetical protein
LERAEKGWKVLGRVGKGLEWFEMFLKGFGRDGK